MALALTLVTLHSSDFWFKNPEFLTSPTPTPFVP